MRLLPSDPDIETLVGRIKSRDIDLQPDFQRGEVWSQTKQRRLIDSILRDWHVPPIHVVQQPDTKKQDVLDGQQRLVAIRDFVNGVFPVDGRIEPIDEDILPLHGLRYAELPLEWKRQFDQFTIRVFRIVDFSPEEPAELFFRLNQPVALTSAEQRNAFFGPVRSQVKVLVDAIEKLSFGFSNSRMALDDVVARVCLSIENGSILEKVTAAKLTQRYRERNPFSAPSLVVCNFAVTCFATSSTDWNEKLALNKATLFSWLWASACLSMHYTTDIAPKLLAHAMNLCDNLRKPQDEENQSNFLLPNGRVLSPKKLAELVAMFADRSSSRVSDVSSVVARDIVIWVFLSHGIQEIEIGKSNPYTQLLMNAVRTYNADDKMTGMQLVTNLMESEKWGTIR